ncbi:hypothetical protein LTR70_008202 [Exophiala xenobiotica]|uniref:F-box domain-containing protein n=1 Tax=Lithohypha guttulata TaxID=1690604 RepID=A0ABR0K1A5_9EURO|nr:hypothetical protein LTR24_007954 [Lithohypha guttulata]KAK5312432.1 hypothetical protein LTR70_008202 [Exophiala xenobiotica]
MARLTDLPAEILHLIIDYLDLPNLHKAKLSKFSTRSEILSPRQFVKLALAAGEYDRIHQNGDALDLINTCTLMRDMMLDTLWRGKTWCDKPFSQGPPNGVLSLTRRISSNVRRWVAVARATKDQLQEIRDWKKYRPRLLLGRPQADRQKRRGIRLIDAFLRARVVEVARELPAAHFLILGLKEEKS